MFLESLIFKLTRNMIGKSIVPAISDDQHLSAQSATYKHLEILAITSGLLRVHHLQSCHVLVFCAGCIISDTCELRCLFRASEKIREYPVLPEGKKRRAILGCKLSSTLRVWLRGWWVLRTCCALTLRRGKGLWSELRCCGLHIAAKHKRGTVDLDGRSNPERAGIKTRQRLSLNPCLA